MNKLFSLFLLLIPTICNAQSIITIATDNVEIRFFNRIDCSITSGDTVTIHAFKKKDDKYNFIIEKNDYIGMVKLQNIPFNVEEKRLKKLPNALSSEFEPTLKELKANVEKRKRASYKKKALEGHISIRITNHAKFKGTEGALGTVNNDDSVHFIGYSRKGYSYKYALYSDKAVGIFETDVYYVDEINKRINATYLPSTEDADVIRILEEKKKEFEEAKVIIKRKALVGEIKGILSGLGTSFTDIKGENAPFENYDTVFIVGYTQTNNGDYYAMYSDKGSGIYKTYLSTNNLFSNYQDINTEHLPSIDDSDVKSKLKSQLELVDSIKCKKLRELSAQLNEQKSYLITAYKNREPIIVTFESWTSNSVGKIEVTLSVTNCSSQTIKYITFQGFFLNAVGDKCNNEIGGGSVWKAQGVGPIGPRPTTLENFDERIEGCNAKYVFDNSNFYSRIADRFFFSSITIQYMNGRTITLSGKNLDAHVIYN